MIRRSLAVTSKFILIYRDSGRGAGADEPACVSSREGAAPLSLPNTPYERAFVYFFSALIRLGGGRGLPFLPHNGYTCGQALATIVNYFLKGSSAHRPTYRFPRLSKDLLLSGG
jgi:hypothetical protein